MRHRSIRTCPNTCIKNHIAHHLLTLFALNASPQEIQRGYTANATYQREPEPLKQAVVNDMHDPSRFKAYLGQEDRYHDFLNFFKKEIDAKGWQNVLNEYLFAGDERAEDMLVRCYSGLLHPLIQLGFAIEFQQPAIVAEALAEAAITENYTGPFYLGSEKAANAEKGQARKSIVHLLQDVRSDEKLRNSVKYEDFIKIREGILKRAPDEMIKYASQFTVTEEDLEERTAEMVNATGKLFIPALSALLDIQPADPYHSILCNGGSEPASSGQSRLLLHALHK